MSMTVLPDLPALPAHLRGNGDARLPQVYQRAKAALAQCADVDECQEWADKALAIASYARQAKDDSLLKMAVKIRARAIMRAGQLLKQVEAVPGGRPPKPKDESNKNGGMKTGVPGHTSFPGRGDAARDAGMSKHQQNTALRVANIPGGDFEKLVECNTPASVKQLAKLGTRAAPKVLVDLRGRDPKDYAASTQGLGYLREFADFTQKADIEAIVRGSFPEHLREAREHIKKVGVWLGKLQRAIMKERGKGETK